MTEEQRASQRQAFGIRADEVLLLNVGVTTWNKGLDVLLKAFGSARQVRKDLRLILKDQRSIYNVNGESFIISTLASCHLLNDDIINAITIIPKNISLAQLRSLYGMADYYVSPYRAEGFNLPVIEAMACGTQVIVTKGGATDEFTVPYLTTTVPGVKFEKALVRGIVADAYIEPDLDAFTKILLQLEPQQGKKICLPASTDIQKPILSWDFSAEALVNCILSRKTMADDQVKMSENPGRRELHIYCDGGFGNRFNGLISGLIIAEGSGLRPIVIWPVNNWCGAAYTEIFAGDQLAIDRELASYVPEKDNFHYLMGEDHLKMGVSYVSPLLLPDWSATLGYIRESERDVFYHTPLIPGYLDNEAIMRQIRALPLRLNLIQRAEDFVRAQGLGEFFGVQIRKTDFGNYGADEENLYTLIEKASAHRFFVCSDERTVEERFNKLPNVCIHPKRAHVEKRVEGSWNTLTADHSGRVYPCNVNRSASSVVDAVVDLLILAKSQIIKTSHSTFLSTALLLQAAFKHQTVPMVPSVNQPEETLGTTPRLEQSTREFSFFDTIRNLGLPAPQGILNLGAGRGRDIQYFLSNGIVCGVFAEPLAEPFAHLSHLCRQIPNYVAVQTLCADDSSKRYTVYVASDGGMSSSILKPKNHLQVFPEVGFESNMGISATTADELILFLSNNGYTAVVDPLDMLYLDVRGAELMVLMGANRTLKRIKYILMEVMRAELYEGQSDFLKLCDFLDMLGFVPNNVHFNRPHTGVALFVRKELLMVPTA
ncbi:hypothetical protein CCP3SC1_180027 [Gammaproteobacteria bacterium]